MRFAERFLEEEEKIQRRLDVLLASFGEGSKLKFDGEFECVQYTLDL